MFSWALDFFFFGEGGGGGGRDLHGLFKAFFHENPINFGHKKSCEKPMRNLLILP